MKQTGARAAAIDIRALPDIIEPGSPGTGDPGGTETPSGSGEGRTGKNAGSAIRIRTEGAGMRTIVIGDVHGCADALRAVLEKTAPAPEDTLVFPGHGPKTRIREERLFRAFFPEESAL